VNILNEYSASMSPEAIDKSNRSRDRRPIIVVPCFNEENRLDEQAFLDLANSGAIRLLFVDDGSTDGTANSLERFQKKAEAIDVLMLPRNQGKAEAVRGGLRHAVDEGATIVGYLDADLATPGLELLRMIRILVERHELMAVFGSRVSRLGSQIRRNMVRHYTGRVFATFASLALGVAVYDTQCGAKVFRVDRNFIAAIDKPFRAAWAFDVVLCQRLFDGTVEQSAWLPTSFYEMPLEQWSDVPGSKVDFVDGMVALGEVIALGIARNARMRKLRHSGGREHPGR
jgi:glycosyltransferase involved in cell wall biosynthesis